MTPEEFAKAMKEIRDEEVHGDTESCHGRADDLLCSVLRELGYGEGVEHFEDMGKWYA